MYQANLYYIPGDFVLWLFDGGAKPNIFQKNRKKYWTSRFAPRWRGVLMTLN